MNNTSQTAYIRLLGTVTVTYGPVAVSSFETRKTAELIAYLACNSATPQPRADLADALWADADPMKARNRLKQALASAHRALAPVEAALQRPLLLATRTDIAIDPGCFSTDIGAFRTLIDLAAKANNTVARRELLMRADNLYAGTFAPNCDGDWTWLERQQLEEAYIHVLLARSMMCRAEGDLTTAREYATRAIRVDPLCEEACQEMLEILTATGALAAAHRHYELFERQLRERIGMEPNRATRDILTLGASRAQA